jgi:hypothetical protein
MEQRIGWPASIVALGFLALVGLMFWRATENMDNFDKIWVVAGPIVGVVVGAIPGFFFAQSARRDQKEAHQRAEAYAAALPDAQMPAAMEMLQHIKRTVQS